LPKYRQSSESGPNGSGLGPDRGIWADLGGGSYAGTVICLASSTLDDFARGWAVDFALALADRLDRNSKIDRWRDDPVAWVERRLGESPWSKQHDILRAVTEHPLVAVESGHGIGKSHLASRAVAWFLDTAPTSVSRAGHPRLIRRWRTGAARRCGWAPRWPGGLKGAAKREFVRCFRSILR